MSDGYGSACPRCGAVLTTGGCMSCGYLNGTLRDRIAADTALAGKSKRDTPIGYVRYELLAEAWDSISRLGRELFDERTRIAELEVRERYISGLYGELIFAVARAWPGETRHEAALRYIRQAEAPRTDPDRAARAEVDNGE